MAVQYMRRVIEKKAKFDIMDLNCLQVLLSFLTVLSWNFYDSLIKYLAWYVVLFVNILVLTVNSEQLIMVFALSQHDM